MVSSRHQLKKLNQTIDPACDQSLSRRNFMKAGIAASGLIGLSSALSIPAMATERELEVFAWKGYFSEEMIAEFKRDTGIQIILTDYDDNAEALLTLKATRGMSFDLVFPSTNFLSNWHLAPDLLAPLDDNKLELDGLYPKMLEQSENLGTLYRGKRYALPFAWGAEGIIFDSILRDYKPGELSWSDQWDHDNRGFVAVRPDSALTSMALMLDGTGERLNSAYLNEDLASEVFGEALLFAIEHKSHVRQFWRDTEGLASAFTLNNCVVGQGWGGAAHNLWKQTKSRFKFLAPKEGALAWMDTMAIPSGAPSSDLAYELINWLLSQKGGGLFMANSGFNSVVKGAEAGLDLAARERFNFSYDSGKAVEKLYWRKAESRWFKELRDIYVRKYMAA